MSMADRARKRAEEREMEGGGSAYQVPEGMEFYTVEEKNVDLDIMPYVVSQKNPDGVAPGDLWYRRIIWVHKNVGADNNMYLCPNKMTKKRCPICEHRAELLKKAPDNADAESKEAKAFKELTDGLKPKERELFNVIDLKHEKKGIQLWDVSTYLFGDLLEEEILSGKPEHAGFAELKGGFTLNCRFTKESFKGKDFYKISRIDFEPREPYTQKDIEQCADLDKILKIPTFEQLERAFFDLEAAEGDGAEQAPAKEEEQPTRRTRTRVAEEEPEKKEEEPVRRTRSRVAEEEPEKKEEEPVRRTRSRAAEEEPPPPPPAKEEAPARTRRTREEPPTDEDQCPHGHKFGEDTDLMKECEKVCKVWEKCSDEFERRKKANKK